MAVSGPSSHKPGGLAIGLWVWYLLFHLCTFLGHARSHGPQLGYSSCLLAGICAVPAAEVIEIIGFPGVEVPTLLIQHLSTCT